MVGREVSGQGTTRSTFPAVVFACSTSPCVTSACTSGCTLSIIAIATAWFGCVVENFALVILVVISTIHGRSGSKDRQQMGRRRIPIFSPLRVMGEKRETIEGEGAPRRSGRGEQDTLIEGRGDASWRYAYILCV